MWLLMREREKNASTRARAESESAVSALNERLAGREQQVSELKERAAAQEADTERLRGQVLSLTSERSQLETSLEKERRASQEKLDVLNEAQQKLSDAFKSLSSDALKSNNQSFLELAKATLEKYQEGARGDLERRSQAIGELIGPVRESLEKFDSKIADLEKARAGAYEGLREQVKGLFDSQTQLRDETAKLVKALGSPKAYGRWGEVQLRRLVELAGMLDHCDFVEQQSVETGDGRLRPDMVVTLPAQKTIVVDVKVPMSAFLEASSTDDEQVRSARLADHVRLVKDHMAALSRKSYWEQFDQAPEFVVMFLPNETFLTAALQQDAGLIEHGVEQRVILATPTTLIALLKAVAFGWRQERIAASAAEISDLGNELYKRLCDMGGHLADLGSKLGKAVDSYNRTIGSLETRVLVSARRFQDLAAASEAKSIAQLEPLDQVPRRLQAEELTPETASDNS
jgi:DNA recombination protein RmuC